MEFKYIHMYTNPKYPGKGVRILEDYDGWLYVAKLPPSIENIFYSIEEIELVLGMKLTHYKTYENHNESKNPI